MKETTTVTNESGGKRLDVWLAEAAEISRSRAQQLIESGEVLLNGKTAKKRDSVSPGDEVTYEIPEPEEDLSDYMGSESIYEEDEYSDD